jgi:hypothetical protein
MRIGGSTAAGGAGFAAGRLLAVGIVELGDVAPTADVLGIAAGAVPGTAAEGTAAEALGVALADGTEATAA